MVIDTLNPVICLMWTGAIFNVNYGYSWWILEDKPVWLWVMLMVMYVFGIYSLYSQFGVQFPLLAQLVSANKFADTNINLSLITGYGMY